MTSMKLAVVGGGSTYTPELVDGFARMRAELDVGELWLVDPDEGRLRLVGGMSERMWRAAGHPGRVVTTTDLVAGVSDADVVLIQLGIGGQHGVKVPPDGRGIVDDEHSGSVHRCLIRVRIRCSSTVWSNSPLTT